MRLYLSESFKFVVRHGIPPIVIGASISFYVFSLFELTFWEFTFIYWFMSFVAYLLHYKATKWTDYVVKNYGLHFEGNPFMRRMYSEKNFKDYYIVLVVIFVCLLILYILGACIREFVPFPIFLIGPSAFLSVTIYDFVNDFWPLRKMKRQHPQKLNGQIF